MIIEDINPHGSYVHKAHFRFDWNELRPICKNLVDTTKHEVYLVENGKSSIANPRQPHRMPEFSKFYEYLSKVVKQVATEKYGYHSGFKYPIGNSWVNFHGKDGKTLEHNHPNAFLVAATYLHMPENGGSIQFKDPLEYHKSVHEHEDSKSWFWKDVSAVTGDILIFPGWLRHRTHPNNSDINRWVLTTNFIQTLELKR